MKSFLIISVLLLAVVLQTTLVPFLAFRGVSPNLVLILILFVVIFKGFRESWWLVILVALFLDVSSGLPFGLISLSLLTIAYLIDWLNEHIFSGAKFWITVALVVLGSLFYDLILIGLSKLFILINLSQREIYPDIFSWSYLITLFLVVAYNLVSFVFLYALKKIFYQK